MPIDGVWDAVITSPMGEVKSAMVLKCDGNVVTGESVSTSSAPVPLLNGRIDGDQVSWAVELTSPMRVRVEVAMTLSGDTMAGTARAGFLGKFPVSATRRG
jgi:hypothetical protein